MERLDRVTRVIGPTPHQLDNFVLWSDVDAATADAEINAQVQYFATIGHNFEWTIYGHDQPPDLAERLLTKRTARWLI